MAQLPLPEQKEEEQLESDEEGESREHSPYLKFKKPKIRVALPKKVSSPNTAQPRSRSSIYNMSNVVVLQPSTAHAPDKN